MSICMSDWERLETAAEEFGWEAERRDTWTVVLTRPGQRSPRIVLQFTTVGRLQDAYYGTDKKPTRFARPLLASALAAVTE